MQNSTWTFLIILILFFFCNPQRDKSESQVSTSAQIEEWEMKPFLKADSINPVILPSRQFTFMCPIRGEKVYWEEKDVFNPAAVFFNDSIYLIYRAEDTVGKFAGTSRLGLAVSSDGFHFIKRPEPVLYPAEDYMKRFEWEGGCEDPRIVKSEEGTYFLTYTAWDGKTARLAVASSTNLVDWKKHGLVFAEYKEGKYRDQWSKSGSIVCKRIGDQLVATKINGKYWMYWGDTDIFLAHSEDLLIWVPLESSDGSLLSVIRPRRGYFDSDLVEPGPPAILMNHGIWMIYNSRNHPDYGDPDIPEGTYAAGQVLLDRDDPARILARSEKNFFEPENEYEIMGQIGNVCFLEGLVPVRERWFLYYGTADSKIAVAVYNDN